MTMNDKIQKYLNESPDQILFKVGRIRWSDEQARPFGWFKNKLYVGDSGQDHYSMCVDDNTPDLKKEFKEFLSKDKGNERDFLQYSGRVWVRTKIMSFWNYPDKDRFKKTIEALKAEKVPVDDSWSVEVFDDMEAEVDSDSTGKLIPISEYTGKKIDIKRVKHEVSPMKKTRDKSIKPGYMKIKLPKNMTLAQYNALVKQEAEDFVPCSFSKFYFDEKKICQ